VEAAFLAPLSPRERTQFTALLRRIAEHLRPARRRRG
jgi:hypothetical protein